MAEESSDEATDYEATDKEGSEKTASFPACCEDIAERMPKCGRAMQAMMSRFGTKCEAGECCRRDERRELR